MKVDFRDSFAKDLKVLKVKGLGDRIRDIIEIFEKADSLAEIPNLKRLKGGGSYYRVRVGGYRLGLAMESDTVIFVRFLDRKDIYKHFP